MTQLSININKVATLRNTRTIGIPSVTHCARLCLDAGAHGITVHPRPDQRHIRPHDVADVAALLKEYPHAEFNIEGNPFHTYMEYAEQFRPAQCTLVPDETAQFTSDHGWDLAKDGARLSPVIARLKFLGCRVSLFLDPLPDMIPLARKLGADRIELYTEPYAAAYTRGDYSQSLATFRAAALAARNADLAVNAGHDLNRANLPAFLAAIPHAAEVSIGHAIIADALEFGFPETVRKYLAITSAPASARS